jgi:hypothetical protein
MFNIDEKDYWVITSVSENGEIYLIKISPDLIKEDHIDTCFGLGTIEEHGIPYDWRSGLPEGIYKVELTAKKDINDDYIEEFTVDKITMLYQAP